jgi:hypothetical protein
MKQKKNQEPKMRRPTWLSEKRQRSDTKIKSGHYHERFRKLITKSHLRYVLPPPAYLHFQCIGIKWNREFFSYALHHLHLLFISKC